MPLFCPATFGCGLCCVYHYWRTESSACYLNEYAFIVWGNSVRGRAITHVRGRAITHVRVGIYSRNEKFLSDMRWVILFVCSLKMRWKQNTPSKLCYIYLRINMETKCVWALRFTKIRPGNVPVSLWLCKPKSSLDMSKFWVTTSVDRFRVPLWRSG